MPYSALQANTRTASMPHVEIKQVVLTVPQEVDVMGTQVPTLARRGLNMHQGVNGSYMAFSVDSVAN